MKAFKVLVLTFVVACFNLSAQETEQIVAQGRTNDATHQQKPYVILISADGFRYDLARKYHAENLLQLSESGVAAAFLQPSFPSLTFPNHYTIATGMYPSHHGLVDNSMYDPAKKESYSIGNRKAVRDSSWYGGIPLWVLAEQQKMLAASFYWVGSESAVSGVRPTYYYNYSEKIDIDARIAAVKAWLSLPEATRPHLITFYLPEVDHAEHKYGPESKEAEEAVAFVDQAIRKMVDTLGSLHLPINFIFVADHGMTTVDTKNTLGLPVSVDTAKFKVSGGSSMLHLYGRNLADIEASVAALKKEASDFDVYEANEVPAKWHYGKQDDRFGRIGDIIIVPHLPKVFNIGKYPAPIGQHGFDPELPEMRATFYAWGPAFKKHKQVSGFENIHIYPMIAEILGLKYTHAIDGKLSVLAPILR